ncbi:sulfide:quinone oxidoreductase, mitochondrial-like [Choristoneura fumiferana]|uniref:sulfide:quinone oxidoreductase, mitochondrial-like n=1 Tax=Choristoneura fumiferana TaxID=7141 RepID=UPI003D159309
MAAVLHKLNICKSITSRIDVRLVSSVHCGNKYKCKLLIIGGGTGGCSVAWRFSRKLKDNEICVIDPAEFHYYQPLFTMVAAGIKPFEQSRRPLASVLPPTVCLLKDYAQEFDPCNSVVRMKSGDRVYYDFPGRCYGVYILVDTLYVQEVYNPQIPGLKPALDDPCSPVSTIYAPEYCAKTWSAISRMKGGHALFTFPGAGAKCSGASQKIMYLADDYYRKKKARDLVNITYNTGSEAIFGVPKYAAALNRIASKRNIAVNCCCELAEVTSHHAVFNDPSGVPIVLPFNLLHVTPPMSPPPCLACSPLAEAGYLDVDPFTLRHKQFHNVYGLGDCTNTPNSKTAAAAARQSYVLEQNLTQSMAGREPTHKYDGYGACALLTSYRTGILAEFLYDKRPCETFPFDQSKERKLFYYMNRDHFPRLYWNKAIKGKWDGPGKLRRFINPLGKKK